MTLRDRNGLLLAAGFAPIHPERRQDDPALRSMRQAVDLVLAGHEPFPAPRGRSPLDALHRRSRPCLRSFRGLLNIRRRGVGR